MKLEFSNNFLAFSSKISLSFTDHNTKGVVTVQFTNNASSCWLNAAITATCWALKSTGLFGTIYGSLPTPKDGIVDALLSWCQLKTTTIVNSR